MIIFSLFHLIGSVTYCVFNNNSQFPLYCPEKNSTYKNANELEQVDFMYDNIVIYAAADLKYDKGTFIPFLKFFDQNQTFQIFGTQNYPSILLTSGSNMIYKDVMIDKCSIHLNDQISLNSLKVTNSISYGTSDIFYGNSIQIPVHLLSHIKMCLSKSLIVNFSSSTEQYNLNFSINLICESIQFVSMQSDLELWYIGDYLVMSNDKAKFLMKASLTNSNPTLLISNHEKDNLTFSIGNKLISVALFLLTLKFNFTVPTNIVFLPSAWEGTDIKEMVIMQYSAATYNIYANHIPAHIIINSSKPTFFNNYVKEVNIKDVSFYNASITFSCKYPNSYCFINFLYGIGPFQINATALDELKSADSYFAEGHNNIHGTFHAMNSLTIVSSANVIDTLLLDKDTLIQMDTKVNHFSTNFIDNLTVLDSNVFKYSLVRFSNKDSETTLNVSYLLFRIHETNIVEVKNDLSAVRASEFDDHVVFTSNWTKSTANIITIHVTQIYLESLQNVDPPYICISEDEEHQQFCPPNTKVLFPQDLYYITELLFLDQYSQKIYISGCIQINNSLIPLITNKTFSQLTVQGIPETNAKLLIGDIENYQRMTLNDIDVVFDSALQQTDNLEYVNISDSTYKFLKPTKITNCFIYNNLIYIDENIINSSISIPHLNDTKLVCYDEYSILNDIFLLPNVNSYRLLLIQGSNPQIFVYGSSISNFTLTGGNITTIYGNYTVDTFGDIKSIFIRFYTNYTPKYLPLYSNLQINASSIVYFGIIDIRGSYKIVGFNSEIHCKHLIYSQYGNLEYANVDIYSDTVTIDTKISSIDIFVYTPHFIVKTGFLPYILIDNTKISNLTIEFQYVLGMVPLLYLEPYYKRKIDIPIYIIMNNTGSIYQLNYADTWNNGLSVKILYSYFIDISDYDYLFISETWPFNESTREFDLSYGTLADTNRSFIAIKSYKASEIIDDDTDDNIENDNRLFYIIIILGIVIAVIFMVLSIYCITKQYRKHKFMKYLSTPVLDSQELI